MVGQEVVPCVRIVEKQQRSGIGKGHIGQFRRGGLAIHRVADRVADKGNADKAPLVVVGNQIARGQTRVFASVHMGGPGRRGQAVIGADEIRVVVERAAKRRVRPRAVVAFAVVFQHKLPVAVFNDTRLVRDLQVGDGMGGGVAVCGGLDGGEIRGGFGKAHKNHACGDVTMQRLQPVFAGVEIGAHVTGPKQAPIGFISPLVVGAD